MQMQYHKQYSPVLGREMEYKVYGHAGTPVLFIPCQNGRFFDFEDFHMAEEWAPWIDSGRVMVFAIDTLDEETWSNVIGDPHLRIRRHEEWTAYIVREMVPIIQKTVCAANGWKTCPGIMPFGCSLGATHALNLYLRFPDVFWGVLALSGIYDASYGFGDYMDELVYLNSPVHYMPNLPEGHPYVDKYNAHPGIVCVGQGPWELPDTTRRLKEIFAQKNIHIWVDLWGDDCAHDWPWWYKQVQYFLPKLFS